MHRFRQETEIQWRERAYGRPSKNGSLLNKKYFTMSSAESVCETGAPTLEQLPGSVDKQDLVLGVMDSWF